MHFVAFLRGINLGRRRIKMDGLRALFEALPLAGVSTFIASGNVIFESPQRNAAKLEGQIEQHLEKALGYAVDTFLRTRAELAEIAAARPFSPAEMDAPEHSIYVGLWKIAPSAAQAKKLSSIRTEVDEIKVIGREYYWLCRIPMNESKVWALPAMRTLELPATGTMRNLTTLRKLAALYPPAKN